MQKAINLYLEASDAPENVISKFEKLVRTLPILPKDPYDAVIAVSSHLKKEGFCYDSNNFTAQDVLNKRAGNCLGLPLIIGAILDSRDVAFTPRVLINPQDIISKEERKFVERYNQEIAYDKPNLADPQIESNSDESIGYRFVPLEHLVLVAGGRTFETTSTESGEVKGGESERSITYAQAVSFVLKDRAIEKINNGETKESKQLAERGLQMWPENRELNGLCADIENMLGNYSVRQGFLEKYKTIGGNDSLFNYKLFFLENNPAFLDNDLAIYPENALAIVEKAASLVQTDLRESRFLFGLASHLYAESSILSLRDFYTRHVKELSQVFGAGEINARLRKYLNNQTKRTK